MPAENSPRPGAKRLQDDLLLGGIQQHDGKNARMGCTQFSEQLETALWLLIEIGAKHHNIDAVQLYGFNQVLGAGGWSDHFQLVIASQCVSQKLSVNSSIVGNKHPNHFFPRILSGLHRSSQRRLNQAYASSQWSLIRERGLSGEILLRESPGGETLALGEGRARQCKP